jgi:hypothetical protein
MNKKQRITKISKREKQAAVTSGVLDLNLPESEIRQRLVNEPRTFYVETVLEELARKVAWLRLRCSAPRMKPSEVYKQAADTIAVIDELIARVDHMNPGLTCVVDELLYRTRGEFAFELRERFVPDLYSIRSALGAAIQMRENEPVRTGPKGNWAALQESVADILSRNSDPPINKAESKALAVELLDLCNVRSLMKRKA